MLQAGVAKANEIGVKISLAVVDASGSLVAFLMNGRRALLLRPRHHQEGDHLGVPETRDRLAPRTASSACRSAWMAISPTCRAAIPIIIDGQVVGGMGAGGAKEEEDVIVARAALAALGLK